MSFERFIGARYLRAKQKQAFISLITYLSIAGVAVGVMALIVVIAVMTGFEVDLKTRILGGQANVVLMRYSGPFEEYRPVMQRIADVDGVAASTPFIYTQVMLRTTANTTGAMLRGIDPATIGGVLKTLENVRVPEGAPPPARIRRACRGSSSAASWPRTWGWSRATWCTSSRRAACWRPPATSRP